jgi:hypothetical protein
LFAVDTRWGPGLKPGASKTVRGFHLKRDSCRALPAKTRGVRTNRGKARRYTQMVLSARGGEDGERFIPQNTRDGAAVLRGREERFLPTRPGAQTTRARKNRAAPLGMTGWGGARDAQPLQAGLNCDAPPALHSDCAQRARRRGWGEIHPAKYAGCGGPLCAGRRFRRSESGRKSRPAPFGMTDVVGWCRVPRPHGLRRFASQA